MLERLLSQRIVGGMDLSQDYPEMGHALLVCATETKTDDDLQAYAAALGAALEAS